MITCESLTIEKVKAELAELEKAYKAERGRRAKKANSAAGYFGPKAKETRDAITAKRELQEAYAPYRRHLQILLAVLECEENPQLHALMADVMAAQAEKQPTEPKEGVREPQ